MFAKIKRSKNEKGFSLVELLVVMLIMSIMAGIAVPIYLDQRTRAYLSTASNDAKSTGDEIMSVVSDYTMFGTQASALTNTIICAGTLPSCTLTFFAMTAATGSGTATATGPGTSSTVRLSAGSTLAGTYSSNVAGNPPAWCIVVTNNGTYAKYTNAGMTLQQKGGSAPTCSALAV